MPAIPLPEWAAETSRAVGWALVWFLPQGLILALVAAGWLRLIRPGSAQARYAVALGTLVAMAVCPVVTAFRAGSPRPESPSARSGGPGRRLPPGG